MTLCELNAVLLTGPVKVVSAKTGKILLVNACKGASMEKYGALDVLQLYVQIETSGHLNDFARPCLIASVYEDEFYTLKNKEE